MTCYFKLLNAYLIDIIDLDSIYGREKYVNVFSQLQQTISNTKGRKALKHMDGSENPNDTKKFMQQINVRT